MKADLDHLMRQNGLDALLVVGSADHNPNMAYFTGLIHLSEAFLLKKQGEEPIIFCSPMERDEAASTGLPTVNMAKYEMLKLLEQAGGDSNKATANALRLMLEEHGVGGRVAIYGKHEVGPLLSVLHLLQEHMPHLEVVGEIPASSVMLQARMTKDEQEVKRIRHMGEITAAVFGNVAEFLSSHRDKDGVLVNAKGEVLTIGEVKKQINLWLARKGAENPEGTIFAAGRDAGVPHSAGENSQAVPVGKTIIMDLFPCEERGGYFYDCTRTWCLGFAPDAALQLYEEVQEVYSQVLASVALDGLGRELQTLTCELFQQKGHQTILHNPGSEEGYVHSLGHGVGLAVHETPRFSHLESNPDRLVAGSVVAIEPGLYYPEREMGARLEDTFWMRPDGTLERLADFSTEFVLKLHST
jgi:Xaa-Pro aminopeptidase